MAQNIYDQPAFFTEYSKLPRSIHGLTGAPEWPLIRTLLGTSTTNAHVLDLCCGFGWFTRWARSSGHAATVHGIDVSEAMLARARQLTTADDAAAVTYALGDLETLQLPAARYDVVFSSLALHYVPDVARLVREIRGALVPRGRFVFSVEHPIFTASVQTRARGWEPDPGGDEAGRYAAKGAGAESGEVKASWLLNSYADEGVRLTDWLADGVRKYHRTIDSWVTTLLANGFVVTALKEYMPTLEDLESHPEWNKERERPLFLIIAAEVGRD
jgi:SAM-dependent methyltransferase